MNEVSAPIYAMPVDRASEGASALPGGPGAWWEALASTVIVPDPARIDGRQVTMTVSVGDGAGHDVLVRQDDALRGVGQADVADQAALEDVRAALFVDVQGGGVVGRQDARVEPVPQRVPGSGVTGLKGHAGPVRARRGRRGGGAGKDDRTRDAARRGSR